MTALRTIIKLSDVFVEAILSSVKLFIVVMVGSIPIYLEDFGSDGATRGSLRWSSGSSVGVLHLVPPRVRVQ